MRVVTPLTIATGGILTSTNVGTSLDPAAYNGATNYALDERCVVGETIYQSVYVGVNTGHNPPDSPDYWLRVGPINKLAMFDRAVGSQTINADTIEVVITPGQVVGVVSLLNLDGASVSLTQNDPVDGEVFATTVNLTEPVSGWWDYLYSPVVRRTSALITGLMPYRNASITITIDNTGGDAKCGVCIVGPSVHPGDAEYGASDGIDDYSEVQPDTFGVRDIVERDYADDAEMTIWVPVADSPRFRRILAERRAKPTLFVLADHRPDAQYYGLPSFRRTFQMNAHDIYALTVKGFT